MNKTVKNVLAVLGAATLVKAAPVLAVGAVIGAVAADPEKAKKTVMDGLDKTMNWVEDLLVNSGVPEEEVERVKKEIFEKEPETVDDLVPEDEVDFGFDSEDDASESATSDEEVNVEIDVANEDEDEDDLTPTEAGNWSAT